MVVQEVIDHLPSNNNRAPLAGCATARLLVQGKANLQLKTKNSRARKQSRKMKAGQKPAQICTAAELESALCSSEELWVRVDGGGLIGRQL